MKTASHSLQNKNIKTKANALIKIIIILFGSLIYTHKSYAEKYEIPKHFIDLCLIASDLEDIPFNSIALAKDVYAFFTSSDFSSEDCKSSAIRASAALVKYYFRKDLSRCKDQTFTNPPKFCSTSSLEDWLKFRESEDAVFIPPPLINWSKFIPNESAKFKQCMKKAETQNAAAVRKCIIKETARHDVILNEAYQCLQDTLPKAEFSELQSRQKDWISTTDALCSHSDQSGSIAADMRIGCRYERTKEKAIELELMYYATNDDECGLPSLSNLEHDKERWSNVDGNPSVSNLSSRIQIACDGGGIGILSPLRLFNLPKLNTNRPLTFEFIDSAAKVAETSKIQAYVAGKNIEFKIHQHLIDQLRKYDGLKITDGKDGVFFPLNNSSNSLSSCQTPKTQIISQEDITHSFTPSTQGVYISLPGDLPIKIRCDRPSPEAYIENSGFMSWLFGSGVNIGDTWSFEIVRRNGKSAYQRSVQAAQLTDGIGYVLDTEFLWEASKSPKLIFSGNGKEHETSIAAQSNDLKNCHRTNYYELERFAKGNWKHLHSDVNFSILNNPTNNTFLRQLNFAGWGTMPGRDFHFFGSDGRNRALVWMLAPSGSLHLNGNEFVCKIRDKNGLLVLENKFDCRLQGEWTRQ